MKYVYKAGCALLALAVIPVLYFLPFCYLRVSSSLLQGSFSQEVSLQWLLGPKDIRTSNRTFTQALESMDYKEAWESLGALRTPLIVFLSALALALLVALAVVIFALFTKKRAVVTSLSGGGLLLLLVAVIAFGIFAAPFLDGSFDPLTLLGEDMASIAQGMGTIGSMLGGLLSSLLGGLGSGLDLDERLGGKILQVDSLNTASAVTTLLILFVLLLVWCFAFHIIDIIRDTDRRQPAGKKLSPVERAKKKAKQQQREQKKKK